MSVMFGHTHSGKQSVLQVIASLNLHECGVRPHSFRGSQRRPEAPRPSPCMSVVFGHTHSGADATALERDDEALHECGVRPHSFRGRGRKGSYP